MPELHAFFGTGDVPSAYQLQRGLDVLQFPVKLDPNLALPDPAGSLRASVGGRHVVIEYHVSPAPSVVGRYPGLRGMFPNRDRAATFRFGHDPVEAACALACLAALAQIASAAWFDPAEGECYSADAALVKARGALTSLGTFPAPG